MRLVVLGLALLVAGGCYDPALASCEARCASPSDCAGGLSCGTDGWCARGESLGRCGQSPGDAAPDDATGQPQTRDSSPGDGPPAVDASPDAPPVALCPADCSGECELGVCVIRCSGQSECTTEVRCPSTGPCRVECNGNKACTGEVVCGEGRCDVLCLGKDSCEHGVVCDQSCGCNVNCTGTGSCHKAATCPSEECVAGRGCSAIGSCGSC